MKKGYSCIEKYPRPELNPVEIIKRWKRNIKYIYQRARYGYCDRDVWSIDYWFLNVVPCMLEELRDHAHGCPPKERLDAKILNGDDMEEWKQILSEMIYLFREANEETCLKRNSYEEEYRKAHDEFAEKYGENGERLKSAEDLELEKAEGLIRTYGIRDLPEYQEIVKKYMTEDRKICKYREACKDKAFELFSKWFFDLWD